MTAEECAGHILKAIEQKKRTLVLTFDGKRTVLVNKLFPGWADKLVKKFFFKNGTLVMDVSCTYRAYSCAACRDSNISYWVHNGFVTVDSEKMSKSLGNFFTIRQVKEFYRLFSDTLVLRSWFNFVGLGFSVFGMVVMLT